MLLAQQALFVFLFFVPLVYDISASYAMEKNIKCDMDF
jgi:Sec-independent protein secretion pathway component TatC